MSHPPSSPRRVPSVGAGLLAAWRAGYRLADLRHDVLAGLTVGVVAVPLAMALAVATGVPPQHGLYTAIVAGALIALTGGSRFNVSGPTAAFVVVLFPVVQQYGLGGLLLATLMAGAILVVLGLARMGTLIQFVPYPVVLGFTAGIAVVIATLQLPNFLGLAPEMLSEHFIDNIAAIAGSLPTVRLAELLIGVGTLAVMLLWSRLRLAIPAPLVGLAVGAAAAWAAQGWLDGVEIATIASRFTWEAGGASGAGIPPLAPSLALPWNLPDANGQPLQVDFSLIRALIGPALAIAMLGAIESLLCAVVADGMTHTRHDSNAELIGQGLGNLVTPFFGGITATAAIARTATNVRSGARSPLAALVHSGVVLAAVAGLAPLLGLVPMASLAALLFVVAWNMADARLVARTLRTAPRGDASILVLCLVLTVVFDMVLAVAVGVGLAAMLFIGRMARATDAVRVGNGAAAVELPRGAVLYDVNGPLFFAAAERAVSSLRVVDPGVRVLLLDMRDVPTIDGTALVALRGLIDDLSRQGVSLVFVGLRSHLIGVLRRAGVRKRVGHLTYCSDIAQAGKVALRWLGGARASA